MLKSQKFICVIGRNDNPYFSYIRYIGMWKRAVASLNETTEGMPYYCAYTLETSSLGPKNAWYRELTNSLSSIERLSEDKELYAIRPEDLYPYIRSFAVHHNISNLLSENGKPQRYNSKEFKKRTNQVKPHVDKIATKSKKKNISISPAPTKVINPFAGMEMDKRVAIGVLQRDGHSNGYSVSNPDNCLFAKKYPNENYYLLRPKIIYFEEDCSIILDDNLKHILYLFDIPRGSFNVELLSRTHKGESNESYVMHIQYDDYSFTDRYSRNSSFRLRQFLVAVVAYNSDNIPVKTTCPPLYYGEPIQRTLDDELKTKLYSPISISYKDEMHRVKTYSDFVGAFLEIMVNNHHQDRIENIARSQSTNEFISCLSLNRESFRNPIQIRGTDCYYDGNISPNRAYEFVRWFIKCLDLDPTSFKYCVRRLA